MEIEFEWHGKVYKGIAEKEVRGGIPGYKVTIRKQLPFRSIVGEMLVCTKGNCFQQKLCRNKKRRNARTAINAMCFNFFKNCRFKY